MPYNSQKEAEIDEYTEAQWEEEMKAPPIVIQFPLGPFSFGKQLKCPRCGTTGFYGPRKGEVEGKIIRKYRACKFCGLWQELFGCVWNERGGDAYRCKMIYCDKCNIYNWREPWGEPGKCSNCHNEYREVKWASDDPNHPFCKIRDSIYKKFGIISNL